MPSIVALESFVASIILGPCWQVKSAAEDVAGVIRQAQTMAAQGKPTVVNVHIGGTDFREGSLSV